MHAVRLTSHAFLSHAERYQAVRSFSASFIGDCSTAAIIPHQLPRLFIVKSSASLQPAFPHYKSFKRHSPWHAIRLFELEELPHYSIMLPVEALPQHCVSWLMEVHPATLWKHPPI